MRLVRGSGKLLVFGIVAVTLLPSVSNADQITLFPSGDVYILTFGGGEGCNPFMKFDISPLPPGNTIDSVFLAVFVWEVLPQWDDDVDFWNVNSQTWTENDSAAAILDIPTSDQVSQATGFGQAVGWTRSVDLTPIFLRDYNAPNTYSSIKLKDPDDPTWVPMPGSMPVNSPDTLAVGNRAFGEHIYFYPREQAGGSIPQLIVYYTEVGIGTSARDKTTPGFMLLQNCPNPFSLSTTISYAVPRSRALNRMVQGRGAEEQGSNLSLQPRPSVPRPSGSREGLQDDSTELVEVRGATYQLINLSVYDLTGRAVRTLVDEQNESGAYSVSWDGKDSLGRQLPTGVYFCSLQVGNLKAAKKIVVLR